jgi:MFS superfamily sulfate permease-like transporter
MSRRRGRVRSSRSNDADGPGAIDDPAVKRLPEWLRGYDRAWLPVDVMAGLTIWALMVPQAMAYAGIAGVPVQNGLYVMPLAVVG